MRVFNNQNVSMRTVLKFLLFLPIIGIVSWLSLSSETSKATATVSKNNQVDSVPVLLLGSFLNFQDDYSFDSIRVGLMNGTIACTKDLEDWAQKKFSLSNKPRTATVKSFNLNNENALVLTTIDSVNASLVSKAVQGVQYFSNSDSYPLWYVTNQRTFDHAKEITHYIHTGVTAITRSTGTVLNARGMDWYLSSIQPFFKSPELVHISNEVSMVDTCNYGTMKLKFATQSNHMEMLKRLKASVIELTGNHNLDFGNAPYLNTLAWYKKNNMSYFGGGANEEEAARPLVKTLKDGKKIAWIGFNEVCPLGECTDKKSMGAKRYNEQRARFVIDSLKRNVGISYLIACVQFTETDSYKPTENQRKISQNLIYMGADVVIGSQAHQAQEIAVYHNKPIFFGLGNFLFDQIHRIGVRQAFFLNCYFLNGKIIQFQPVYTFMSSSRQPNIANAEEKQMIQTSIIKKYNFPIQ
jgi:hypothetical protein